MFMVNPTSLAHKLYESLCLKARNGFVKNASGDDRIEKHLHTRLLSKIFRKEGATDNVKKYEDDSNKYAAKLIMPVPDKLLNRLKAEATSETTDTIPDIWNYRSPLQLLLRMLPHLEFENIKHVRTLFCTLIKNNFGDFLQNFLMKPSAENEWIIQLLVDSYTAPLNLREGYALGCGQMLRECIELEKAGHDIVDEAHSNAIKRLLQKIVTMDNLKMFMKQALKETNFELLNSAQETFKAMVMSERMGEVMRQASGLRFTEFVYLYETQLILPTVRSEAYYMVLRESLKLLGDMLLQRHNYENMMWFIKQKHNLKVFLHLTASKNSKIAFAVFHVLKVFIVNPKKNYCIKRLLFFNKKFLQQSPFFKKLEDASEGDDLVAEEKTMALKQLNDLKDPGKPRFYAVARRQTERHPKNIYEGLEEIHKSFDKRADGSRIEKPVQSFLEEEEACKWVDSQVNREDHLVKHGYIKREVPVAAPAPAPATAGASASAAEGTADAAPALPEPTAGATASAAAAGASSASAVDASATTKAT